MPPTSDLPDLLSLIPQAPYALLIAGLLASLTSGTAFYAGLKLAAQLWTTTRSTRILTHLHGPQLALPLVGMGLGSALFLAATLEIFGLTPPFTYVLSLVLAIATTQLVWFQLSVVFKQLARGGKIDLDAFE